MTYIFNATLWSLLGLVVGFIMGVYVRDTHPERIALRATRRHRVSAPQGAEPASNPHDPAPIADGEGDIVIVAADVKNANSNPAQQKSMRALGLFIFLLSLGSVSMMAVSLNQQQAGIESARETVLCQNDFNKKQYEVTLELRDAAARERTALRNAIEVGLRYPTPQDKMNHAAELQKASNDYLAVLQQGEQRRADNPQPRLEC